MVLFKVGQFMTQEKKGRRGAQNTILRLDKFFVTLSHRGGAEVLEAE